MSYLNIHWGGILPVSREAVGVINTPNRVRLGIFEKWSLVFMESLFTRLNFVDYFLNYSVYLLRYDKPIIFVFLFIIIIIISFCCSSNCATIIIVFIFIILVHIFVFQSCFWLSAKDKQSQLASGTVNEVSGRKKTSSAKLKTANQGESVQNWKKTFQESALTPS